MPAASFRQIREPGRTIIKQGNVTVSVVPIINSEFQQRYMLGDIA